MGFGWGNSRTVNIKITFIPHTVRTHGE